MSADLASSPILTSKVQMPNTFSAASLDKLRAARADSAPQTSKPVMGEQYREVFLSAVVRESALQSRPAFDPESDDDDSALVASIESSGQRTPAQLAEVEGSCPPEYAILDGHRRIAALRHLKRETVKAIIVRQGTQECDLISLTANVRKNLAPLELARAVGRLRERHSLTLAEIAQSVGLSKRYVEMLVSLLKADPAIQAEVEAGRISAKTVRVLSQAPAEDQAALTQVVAEGGLSDVQTRRLMERVATTGEEPQEAAVILGFTSAKTKEAENTSTEAQTKSPSPKRRPTVNSPLAFESALAVLMDLCPELSDEARASLARLAVEHTASLAVLKVAGVLVVAGQTPEEALKSAQSIGPHPHARKIMALMSVCGELRDLVRGGRLNAEARPLLGVVVSRMAELEARSKI